YSYRYYAVSSNISAVPEIIRDGVTGYINEPSDLQGFVSSLTRLLDSRNRETMSKRSVDMVAERYSPAKISSRLLETYLNSMD
ncbi:MAG: hypothetical protein M1587_08100, partial [Thaumarchaeota archaeon]|nr:hypothetical protein [Nitrososphaerota archaeon]